MSTHEPEIFSRLAKDWERRVNQRKDVLVALRVHLFDLQPENGYHPDIKSVALKYLMH